MKFGKTDYFMSILKIAFIWVLTLMVCCLAVGSSISQVSAKIKYKKYYNERFDYTIKYPAKFTEGFTAQNQDGVVKWTKDKEAELVMSGIYNTEALNGYMEYSMFNSSEKPQHTYQVGNDFVRESYKEDGKNVYYYRFVTENIIVSFMVKYPPEQKAFYKKVIKVMKKSIRKNRNL